MTVVTKILDLKQEQSKGLGVVAQIYQMIKTQVDVAPEIVQWGGHELKQLYRTKHLMRINKDSILEVRFVEKEREKWRVTCPEAARSAVIWQTHKLAHSGASRTTNWVKLTWYWPGMVSEICRLIEECKCQNQGAVNHPRNDRGSMLGNPGRNWQ